eukprot:TRINITY_DN60855_c0_g1_i1.p1 TRINITY_DN60855_c0_g1~~TRINITY_DN60855_c0_g1_i1.p1  ORF type:complete len:190 (-),score=55.05 TRINITY_DN60855_c0_g1_i1:73-642(-)
MARAMQLILFVCALARAEAYLRSSSSDDARVGDAPDVVVGHLKGLVDGYLDKYDEETARFDEADAAMAKVVESTMDAQSKERAVDQKLKLKKEHEEKLGSLAGFVRTLDGAVQALKGGSGDWKDDYADLKTKVEKLYAAHPVLVAMNSRVAKQTATSTSAALLAARSAADVAEAYLSYLGPAAPLGLRA